MQHFAKGVVLFKIVFDEKYGLKADDLSFKFFASLLYLPDQF